MKDEAAARLRHRTRVESRLKRAHHLILASASMVTRTRLLFGLIPRVDRFLYKVAEAVETELAWSGTHFEEGDVVLLMEPVPTSCARPGRYTVEFVHPRTRRLYIEDGEHAYSVPSYACRRAANYKRTT